MTSRPSLAVSQRQPQRTVSGSGLPQRPSHQRSLSQQYLPTSPVRKDGLSDLTPDAGAGDGGGRYGTTPRRGGSRLKLELANDGIVHAGFSESPLTLDHPLSANRVFTPSRMMHVNEAAEMGDMSPHHSRAHTTDYDSTPLPMPPRLNRLAHCSSTKSTSGSFATPAKKDIRPKPFVLETPPAAPRYSNMGKPEPSGFADFFPWTGEGPEDRFSEYIIRNGYFDKGPGPAQMQTELATAKGPLFPALKHKSGLHTLSTLFTGILNQRRHSGQITSASTFKPPPRVTLTDTKREVWLKDLANPQISLRRLSRTIPHGIRGKVLLDQCLNKNVPTDRAVWLAKCVGANEIRAFKRKGVNNTFVMGGEAKWIRDWTVFVEQFVDSVVNAYSEAEWKSKVIYAIRLATHLYAEYLLDRDHFLEWLVSGLETSTQAKLPMWILVVEIYLKDILQQRKLGRRLSTAILSHYAIVYQHPDRDILQPVLTRLSALVESLLLGNPANFVHSPTWTRYRDTLLASLPSNDHAQYAAFRAIDERIDRLTNTCIKSQPAVRGVVVKLLDSTLRAPFIDDLATKIWKVGEDKGTMIRTVLEWCTSLHRPGIAKVFVAANTLKAWSAFDIDITGAILDFMNTDPIQETERKRLVYHLVSELVRSGHFMVPRYLQWIIARGGLGDAAEVEPEGPCSSRLLVEIPLHSLSSSMQSLRATILRRAEFSVDLEACDIANATKSVKHALGVPLGPDDPMSLKKLMSIKKIASRLVLSSRALQSEIGAWLNVEYISVLMQSPSFNKAGLDMPVIKFDAVRTILEASQDFTMLQEIIRLLTASGNAELLASCVDTINLHLHIFAATGSAKALFADFYARLKSLGEEQGVGVRPLLASMARLAPRMPGSTSVATQLQNDLYRIDRSSAVDASSPLSDNMANQLQDDETELNEQIEKLASYTSADRPTMERLFQPIINRLQRCWGNADERQRPYCMLLTRLRVFDTIHFDTLMRGWVQHIRKLTHRPPVSHIFPLLVSSGCLSLAILFATASRSPAASGQEQSAAVGYASIYMQEILQMLMMPITPNLAMTVEDCYRFRIIQEQARLEHAKEVMPLIRGALLEFSSSRTQQVPIAQPLEDEKTRLQFMELLRSLILVDPDAASQTLALKGPDPKLASLIESVTTKLLIPRGGGGQKTFEQVLELANEFTLPFGQVKLSLNLAVDDSSGPDAAERIQAQLVQLSKAMDNAIDANNIMWTGMLSSLSPEITQHIKNRVDARLLELVPSLKNSTMTDDTTDKDILMAENLLAAIDAINRSTASLSRSSQLTSVMAEKLADLWDILASTNDSAAALKNDTLTHWLPLMLSYLTIHATPSVLATEGSKSANEARAKAVVVLAGLTQELDHLQRSELAERAFDLTLVLVDNLPDDNRLQCVRAVKDATSDVRLRYLLSFAANPADCFMLAHRDKPPASMSVNERRAMAMGLGLGMMPERLSPFVMRRWEILSEPTANVGENDTSLSLHLFEARKIQ